jgi:hypothetical protein
MKTLCLFCVGLALFLIAGCANLPVSSTGTTSIKLTGTPGASFTGFYVKDGKQAPLAGAVPWSLEVTNISRLEIVKVNPNDSIAIELRYQDANANTTDGMALGSGILGARVKVRSGFTLTAITR